MLLPFDVDDPDFARGFEAGALWSRLRLSGEKESATIHASNAEMALRMSEALGRSVRGEALDESWMLLTIEAP
jgi:hypothetical protein